MKISKLDHVNVRTTSVPEMTAWYCDVLGLKDGPRPHFPFSGKWLYAGEDAVVHLVAHDGQPSAGSEIDLKLEHFAFAAKGRDAFRERLTAAGIPFSEDPLEDAGLVQFNIKDPDGNHIHVDFRLDEGD